MKQVIYGDKLQQAQDLYAQAQQATKLLEHIVRAYASRVTAEWDLSADDQGHPLVTLRLADGTDAHTATLTPWDFGHADVLRLRLYGLWSDLLRERNEEQIRRLMEADSPGE